jgi:hypothetical protein
MPVLPPLLVFNFFKISHFYVFKNYGLKYVDIYVHEKCMQKSPGEKYFKFWEIQENKFLTK